jgi:hypothetical protein
LSVFFPSILANFLMILTSQLTHLCVSHGISLSLDTCFPPFCYWRESLCTQVGLACPSSWNLHVTPGTGDQSWGFFDIPSFQSHMLSFIVYLLKLLFKKSFCFVMLEGNV